MEQDPGTVTIRMFGLLHGWCTEHGAPTTVEVEVPAQGQSARSLAVALGLPLDLIEAVFCNRVVYPLDHVIRPGDRVAFVPQGVPGPHRVYLGIYGAGKAGRGEDRDAEG